jgi:hypothetical protein
LADDGQSRIRANNVDNDERLVGVKRAGTPTTSST